MVQRNGDLERRRRAVPYCRVSTSDQDNVRQERDLRETLSGIRKAKGKQPIERKKVMALAITVNEILKRYRAEHRARITE